MDNYRTYGPKDEQQDELGDVLFLGVNERLEPDKVQPGMLCRGRNVRMRNGVVEQRLGGVKPAWLNGIDPSGPTLQPMANPCGAGVFKDPLSRQWVLLAGDGGIYRCRPHNARFALPLPSGVTIQSRVSFVQAFNQVFCFRGRHLAPLVMSDIDQGFEDVVQRWDASTVYDALVQVTGQAAEEVAYGPFQYVQSISQVNDVLTVVTEVEHGYVTGADLVWKEGLTLGLDGKRVSVTVVDAVTFTCQVGGVGPINTTWTAGTGPQVSNMALYWKALGSQVTLTTLTRTGTTATATKNGHGFSNNQYVTIAGATPAGYNGTYQISGVTSNTFQYTLAADPGADATGTITARTSVVLAGQSPTSNPEAWVGVWNILPNADDALYINNRLLVPTAYTPGLAGYDSTSSYTKKDFIVATDILDPVHFDFADEFRINQGSDDEIVCLVKYGPDSAIVFKDRSWGVLTNISLDLSSLSLDMREGYGACAPRSAVVAGKNVLFPSARRGVCSLQQNELGQTRSVDVPWSNDLEKTIGRVNWSYATNLRLAWWDDKLFVAAPLDDGYPEFRNLVPPGATYSGSGPDGPKYILPTHPGEEYIFIPGANEASVGTLFTATSEGTAIGPGEGAPAMPVTAQLYRTGGRQNLIPDGSTYAGNPAAYTVSGLRPGGLYVLVPSNNERPAGEYPEARVFVAPPSGSYTIYAGDANDAGATVTAFLYDLAGAPGNNAVLVYDFRCGETGSTFTYDFQSGQWQGYDDGEALRVLEWFQADYNGRDRLFFLGADGWVNLYEESAAGDQVPGTMQMGLGWDAVQPEALSRGYGRQGRNQYKRLDVALGVLNAQFTLSALTGAANSERPVRALTSFSRFKYLKPAGKADYVEGNANGDFATAGRGNYAVMLPADPGLAPGVTLGLFQEVTVRPSVRTLSGRFAQFRVVNYQGRLKVKAIATTEQAGQRGSGILI